MKMTIAFMTSGVNVFIGKLALGIVGSVDTFVRYMFVDLIGTHIICFIVDTSGAPNVTTNMPHPRL